MIPAIVHRNGRLLQRTSTHVPLSTSVARVQPRPLHWCDFFSRTLCHHPLLIFFFFFTLIFTLQSSSSAAASAIDVQWHCDCPNPCQHVAANTRGAVKCNRCKNWHCNEKRAACPSCLSNKAASVAKSRAKKAAQAVAHQVAAAAVRFFLSTLCHHPFLIFFSYFDFHAAELKFSRSCGDRRAVAL